MSKQQQQQHTREARTFGFWGGRPLKRSSSDLFLDRPGPSNTIFSGKIIYFIFINKFIHQKVQMLYGLNDIHLEILLEILAKVKHLHFDHLISVI
jgi:hypothetical protein